MAIVCRARAIDKRRVNPGEHVIVVTAEGHTRASQTIVLGDGEVQSVTITLQADPGAAPAPTPAPDPVDTPQPDKETTGASSFPLWMTVGLSIGVAGFAVGGITGALSLSEAGTLSDACSDDKVCDEDPALQDAQDSGLLLAHISNVGFAVGAAGVIFGVIAIFTLDASDDTELSLWPGGGGMRGRF